MKKVLISQKIPDEALELLKGRAEIILSPDPSEDVIAGLLPDCDAIIVRTATKLSRATLNGSGKLKCISRTGTGVDNIDISAASDNGIMVCNTPSANTKSVAEHTLAMMLSLMKQIVKFNYETKKGNWESRDRYTGTDLNGKKLGLIGFGRIGQETARMCSVLGMEIHYYDPALKNSISSGFIRHKEMSKLLAICDVISLHLPLRESTRRIIGKSEINLMKEGACIINTSRGGLVDEEALLEGIRIGKIKGACLDVFENEPLEKDSLLCNEDKIIMTPHAAALTPECKLNVAIEAVKNVLNFIDGNPPAAVVNPVVLETG